MTEHVNSKRLPRFILDLLAACPSAGDGVHNWLFRVARVLHPFYANKAELVALIEGAAANCGRQVPEAEILAAVANSEACAWQPGAKAGHPTYSRSAWPAVDGKQVEAITTAPDAPGLADLWERSPVRYETGDAQTEALIDLLFPSNPLLCCGHTKSAFCTRPREGWRGRMDRRQFIVPSPMTAEKGLTKDGKLSYHALDNTGERRFLIVEFDDNLGEDSQAARHWHLSRLAPLVLAVHSGGKSVHGWYFCEGQPESKLKKFMSYAVSLGADKATWTRSQFVRMPDGTRQLPNGSRTRQGAIYFNPENLP